MSHERSAAMIGSSTVVMFALMFSTAHQWEHPHGSRTRSWTAPYMGASMAVIKLSFMRGVYSDRRENPAIFAGSAGVFGVACFRVRSQATVDDVAYMRATIPHHSIAILTSERAELSDPRGSELANRIIESRRQEIVEMEALIAGIEGR